MEHFFSALGCQDQAKVLRLQEGCSVQRLLLLSARTSPRTHPGEVEGRLCKGDWKAVLDTELTFVLAKVLASSERANAVVSIKILKVPVFNLYTYYGLDRDISRCLLLHIFTLDAKDFSCVVSGFCQVYILPKQVDCFFADARNSCLCRETYLN